MYAAPAFYFISEIHFSRLTTNNVFGISLASFVEEKLLTEWFDPQLPKHFQYGSS